MLSGKQKLQIAGAFLVLLLFATVVGCNGFFVNPTLTSIAVGPTATIQQNGTVQMSAVGTYNDGSTSSLSNVLWSSSDTGVAGVSTSGLVTGISPGTSTITGASGTVSGTATITVALSNVTGIAISPTTASAAVDGGTADFTASATISSGSPVDITATGSWSISSVKGGTGTPTTSDFAVVQGQTPEVVTVQSTATVGEQATVTVSYTSGSNTFTANATLTVTAAP
jgi:trimeric autotransporter adhesin